MTHTEIYLAIQTTRAQLKDQQQKATMALCAAPFAESSSAHATTNSPPTSLLHQQRQVQLQSSAKPWQNEKFVLQHLSDPTMALRAAPLAESSPAHATTTSPPTSLLHQQHQVQLQSSAKPWRNDNFVLQHLPDPDQPQHIATKAPASTQSTPTSLLRVTTMTTDKPCQPQDMTTMTTDKENYADLPISHEPKLPDPQQYYDRSFSNDDQQRYHSLLSHSPPRFMCHVVTGLSIG